MTERDRGRGREWEREGGGGKNKIQRIRSCMFIISSQVWSVAKRNVHLIR